MCRCRRIVINHRDSGHGYGQIMVDVLYIRIAKPRAFFCQKAAEFITEEMIVSSATTDFYVVPEDCYHRSTERDDLNFSVLCMPENDLPLIEVNNLDLNVSHCCSPAAAVQQEMHNRPIFGTHRSCSLLWASPRA